MRILSVCSVRLRLPAVQSLSISVALNFPLPSLNSVLKLPRAKVYAIFGNSILQAPSALRRLEVICSVAHGSQLCGVSFDSYSL